MTVRAFDLGTPSLYSDVNVKVFILDQNDHAPKVPFPLILLRVAITLIPISVSITSVPISTFKPTNTRWTNEHFQLLSYYKDLREKIKSNPFPVPNPQILGGHPRGHTWRHSCTAGIFTNTDNNHYSIQQDCKS